MSDLPEVTNTQPTDADLSAEPALDPEHIHIAEGTDAAAFLKDMLRPRESDGKTLKPNSASFFTADALDHALRLYGNDGANKSWSEFKATYRDSGLRGWKDLVAEVERRRKELLGQSNLDSLVLDDEPEVSTGTYEVGDRDPHQLARAILQANCANPAYPDVILLRYWQDTFWIFNGITWDCHYPDEFTNKVNYWIEQEFVRIVLDETTIWAQQGANPKYRPIKQETTPTIVAAVIAAIKALPEVSLTSDIQQPHFIGKETPPFNPASVLTTPDGLVDYDLLGQGKLQIYPHSPDFFSCHSVNFTIELNPTFSESEKFLQHIFPDKDDPRVLLLGEHLGHLFSGDQQLHAITLWVGPSRAGKGTLAKLCREIIGKRYTHRMHVNKLGEQFEMANFVGKRLAIDYDCRFNTNRDNNSKIVEMLLSLSAFDPVSVDRKHTSSLPSMMMPVKLLILSNAIPRFYDSVLSSRFQPLAFTESFLHKEDRGLLGRLIQELPGWIRFAAVGWERFKQQGWRFTRVESAEEMLRDIEYQAYPLKQWHDECLMLDPQGRMTNKQLHDSWAKWCLENRREDKYDSQTLSPAIRQLNPSALKSGKIREGDTIHRGILGVRLATAAEWLAKMEADPKKVDDEE